MEWFLALQKKILYLYGILLFVELNMIHVFQRGRTAL